MNTNQIRSFEIISDELFFLVAFRSDFVIEMYEIEIFRIIFVHYEKILYQNCCQHAV